MDDRVEVRAGDVLLFRGGGFVSWAIRAFDGTDVNHAAIALDSTTLGEAGGRGLQRTLIETATKSNRYMRVRRHTDPDPGPVLTVASTYLDEGRPYAYQQIVLLALLASTRRLRLTGIARRMLRSVLDHGAAALNAFVDRGGARSMICSEFVYRVYAEAVADPADRYRLLIPVGDTAFDAEATSLAEWALVQPDDVLESAAAEPVSFGAPSAGDPALADERAELELAPILAAWAVESGRAGGEDMPPLPPPSFSPDRGGTRAHHRAPPPRHRGELRHPRRPAGVAHAHRRRDRPPRLSRRAAPAAARRHPAAEWAGTGPAHSSAPRGAAAPPTT